MKKSTTLMPLTVVSRRASVPSRLLSQKNTLLNLGLALLTCQSASAQFSPSCLTKSIDISTGFDHASSKLYPTSTSMSAPVLDKYWQITGVPVNTTGLSAPSCAQLFDTSLTASSWPSSAGCAYLGVVADPEPANKVQIAPTGNFFWNCPSGMPYAPTSTPTTFSRSFYVQSASKEDITITIPNFWADDYARIYLDKTRPVYTIATTSTTHGVTVSSITLNVSPGVHTIDVQLWDVSGVASGIKLSGTITSKNTVLAGNTCFGKTDDNCILDKKQLGIAEQEEALNKIVLAPNPSSSGTKLRLEIPSNSQVKVSVMDLAGRMISEIHNGVMEPGMQELTIPTANFIPGIYRVNVNIGNESFSKQLSVVH